jgi:3-hydroxyacyl-[acyl-carrier-protein] dehydratase
MAKKTNIENELLDFSDLAKKRSFGYEDICRLLPQRPPFLMVDRVIDLDVENNFVICEKCISANEWYFQGHFPEHPVMTGVLILEALAQTASILGKFLVKPNGVLMFAAIDKVKFLDVVLHGDVLRLRVDVVKVRDPLLHGECVARVGDKIVAQCTIKAFRKEL